MKIKQIFIPILIAVISIFSLTSCVDNDDYSTPPVPPEGFFKESFDNTNAVASPWPKIANVTGFDNGAPVTFSDPFGFADIRKLSNNQCVWFPANKDSSLIIDNIPTEGKTDLTLKYKFNAGVYNAGEISNANKLILKCNDVEIALPDMELNFSNSQNKFITVMVKIPDGTTKIEFYGATANNNRGFRIDDIEIIEKL